MNRDPIEINGRIWIYDASSRTHRPAEAVNHNHDPGEVADVESTFGNESFSAGEGPAFVARVSIEIISYRVRLADPSGISEKAAIDGLVNCGILADDSLREIQEPIIHRQVKVKNASDEKTEIVITEV
jgi:hypothetical protein